MVLLLPGQGKCVPFLLPFPIVVDDCQRCDRAIARALFVFYVSFIGYRILHRHLFISMNYANKKSGGNGEKKKRNGQAFWGKHKRRISCIQYFPPWSDFLRPVFSSPLVLLRFPCAFGPSRAGTHVCFHSYVMYTSICVFVFSCRIAEAFSWKAHNFLFMEIICPFHSILLFCFFFSGVEPMIVRWHIWVYGIGIRNETKGNQSPFFAIPIFFSSCYFICCCLPLCCRWTCFESIAEQLPDTPAGDGGSKYLLCVSVNVLVLCIGCVGVFVWRPLKMKAEKM